MNIFEGARRASMVLAGVISICFVVATYNDRVYITVPFLIRSLGSQPVMKDGCSTLAGDALKTMVRLTPEEDEFQANFCFKAAQVNDGRALVPYKMVGGMIMADTPSSDEVTEYTHAIAANFTISDKDNEEISSRLSHERMLARSRRFGGLMAFLFCFWAFISVIGWIVRGFAGIPNGRDSRA